MRGRRRASPQPGRLPQRGAASITKVLIANRGEIAVRVARACRDLGITSVAVYSEADRGARTSGPPTRLIFWGAPRPRRATSRSSGSSMPSRARGADAVHPGYGFLAENAAFARAVTGGRRCWVGPPPRRSSSWATRSAAERPPPRPGSPPSPGPTPALSGPEEVVEFGDAFGWPVAIKAAFGGGGRGMRVVASAGEAAEALESAQREAERRFRAARVLPGEVPDLAPPRRGTGLRRHHGNVVHLGTRDCSVQRRHQKLVEEAPAPDLPRSSGRRHGGSRGPRRPGLRVRRTPGQSSSFTRTASSTSWR